MNDRAGDRANQTHLIEDACARGSAALAAGAKAEGVRWLDRAHRLAPADGTITLLLASALLGDDNARAAGLYAEVVATYDVRDAWLGLAAARLLAGEMEAAEAALQAVLSRHAWRPDVVRIAEPVARARGWPGWCGLTGEGVLIVHSASAEPIDTRMDGIPILGDRLPPDWRRGEAVTVTASGVTAPGVTAPGVTAFGVTASGLPLIGSPISPRAIGRIEGYAEAWQGGVRGWAWHPGDPDTDPRLSVTSGRRRADILATEPAEAIPGLPPLARPRRFALSPAELPGPGVKAWVRGPDGRELRGSPVMARPVAADPASKGAAADPSEQCPRLDGGERNPPAVMNLRAAPAAMNFRAAPAATTLRARRMDLTRWSAEPPGTMILVTHADGGGVEQRVQTEVAALTARGRRAVVLRPVKSPDRPGGVARVVAVDSKQLPTLRFELPREQRALTRLLRGLEPVGVALHHLLGHDPSLVRIIGSLGVPYDVHTHDFAWFCPRIALVGRGDRYCGEPAPDVCEICVAETGAYWHEDISVAALLERSRGILFGARRVIAPSRDAADRMARHFPGLSPTVIAHEDDNDVAEPPPIPLVTGTLRVCVAGAIGLHKGYHVLLACARDARQRALDISFVVAGTTIDDQPLIEAGVFVTGPYRREEAVALIRAQNAALALLPSIWPETWCLGLTELWRAGLRVAAFDIGAPAARIRQTGRGFLLPLGISPGRINDALLHAAAGRSLLPIRRASAYKPSGDTTTSE